MFDSVTRIENELIILELYINLGASSSTWHLPVSKFIIAFKALAQFCNIGLVTTYDVLSIDNIPSKAYT